MLKRGRVTLMIGIALLLALLIPISLAKYKQMILQSRESTLKVNLAAMRGVIKQFTQDKKRAPQSLQDLIDAGYFRQLPIDPLTNSNSTWEPVIETAQGITDVHSGASSVSSDGRTYRNW
jgi:general secretion pathway protein G